MAEYDLLVRGGTVVDGTGAAAFRGDVGVRGGRIVDIGALKGQGAREVDAEGAIVAPGFVDIHTHYDAQVFWDRMMTISPWHGVTTVILGNCGFGVAPTKPRDRDLILRTLENVEGMSLDALQAGLGAEWPFSTFGEFLSAIESRGTAIHVGAMVGHTPIRTWVMGEDAVSREASPEEIEEMRVLVAAALAEGALGFATSKAPTHVGYDGNPVPSRMAAHEEILALGDCLREAGKGTFQSTIGQGLLFDELAEIQQRIGRPVTWTALLGGLFGPDGHRKVLEKTAEHQAAGIEVYPQVTGRPLMLEFDMGAPFPFGSIPAMKPAFAADKAGKMRLYSDPDFRAAFEEATQKTIGIFSMDHMWVSRHPTDDSLAGVSVTDVGARKGQSPVLAMLDLALETELAVSFRMAVANRDEDVVAELLSDKTVVLGLSDAGAHASQLCDAGASTHLLGHWVREKEVLSMEEAVRKLTSEPADLFGLADRGRIAPGQTGDLAIFDPATVRCGELERVHDFPGGADRLIAPAEGMRAVVVAGEVLREEGVDQVDPEGALPGRVVRS
ncbi:MAG: amidohydrolase family protein [Candidatus Binatia bacterium]|nr:amidohydrolase family protein [Candidatus Binatia bacterium]MDG2008627.1 amidohydrolase family protein [Candidatus Binatia bacterium]